MRRAFNLCLLLLAGCTTLGERTPQGPLAAQIGHQVELKGSYGIGKLADIITLKDGPSIYLFNPSEIPSELKPEDEIIASGKLEFNRGSTQTPCHPYGCAGTGIMPHYFIRGASVAVPH